MDAAIWGLLGTIVGGLVSIATTWLTTKTSYLLQQEKTVEERAELARSFQRQTLLDLQEAIHDALRLLTRAYLEDCDAQSESTEWGRGMLSEEVNEGVRLAQRRVSILIERVADTDLRTQVKVLMSQVPKVLLSRREDEARHYLHGISDEANRVLEGIGVVLRQQYNPAAILPTRQKQ